MGNIPEQNRWYPLRVTYGREMKLKDRLDKLHLTSYIPMRYKNMVKDGKTRRVLAPAVSNLCFVYSSRKDIEELRTRMMETLQFHFIWNRATSLPIVVPDKAMDDFIRVSETMREDIVSVCAYIMIDVSYDSYNAGYDIVTEGHNGVRQFLLCSITNEYDAAASTPEEKVAYAAALPTSEMAELVGKCYLQTGGGSTMTTVDDVYIENTAETLKNG